MNGNLFGDWRDRVVVFDTETSGFGNSARILELTAVAVEDGQPVNEISTLINPSIDIDPRASKVHGITAEMLVGQPEPAAVYPALMKFIGSSPVIGHNVSFDRRMLDNELKLLGHPPLRAETFCTMALARRKLPHLENHRLLTVYEHLFGPSQFAAHRSFGDVMMTIGVWLCLRDV